MKILNNEKDFETDLIQKDEISVSYLQRTKKFFETVKATPNLEKFK
jgi:hypothetical protein